MHKKYLVPALLAFILLCVAVPTASAHESRAYTINGVPYTFTVGSLGEPVVVDDKTGLDLSITKNGEPLTGAETILKAEIGSGSQKKMFDLETVYGAVGKYKTTFFITSSEPLSYRIFGTLEGKSVDFLFTCSAAGHAMHAVADTSTVQISDGITRTLARGAFGCPAPKTTYEFPQTTADQAALAGGVTLGKWMGGVALFFALLSSLVVLTGKGAGASVSLNFFRKRSFLYGLGAVIVVVLVSVAYSMGMLPGGKSMAEAPDMQHMHAMKEVDASKPAPTIKLNIIKDPKEGYNLHIQTTNFRFTPEKSGGPVVNGTGHAHVFVNGVKVGRAYGEWYFLGPDRLSPGKNTIQVSLNADDHSEWTVGGEHISDEGTVAN